MGQNDKKVKFEIPVNKTKSHQFNTGKKEKRPNVLLLMTDQQRFDTIHAAGYHHMHTPNLDRLVSEGCLYSHAFTPVPICLPTRHNLLTGLPPRYHGYPDNVEHPKNNAHLPTTPRILSNNGYFTHAVGKMHFLPPRRHNGYLRLELMEELPFTREEDEYAMYLKEVGLGHIQNIHGIRNLLYMLPQRSLIPEEHHGTKWVGDRTIDFLKTNRGREPFFLKSSWIAPHPPFDVTDRFANLYANVDLPEPFQSQTPMAPMTRENEMLGDIPNETYLRRMREVYYASISMVDEQVGRILDTLEETDLLDNTMIIFLSDHGEFLGDYGLYQKWNPYDVCSRIPLIIRCPERLAPGSVVDDFVDLNDIMPTILDYVNLDYPADYDLPGESLLKKNPQKDRSWQYVEYAENNRRWISIRNKFYKYNYYYGGGFEQLFDMQNDPAETTNLLHESNAHESIRLSMREKLLDYERRNGLEGYVGEDDFKVGPEYQPHPQRNEAFQRFTLRITDPKEKEEMNSLVSEIPQAVAKEPVVNLKDLDIDAWQNNLKIPKSEVDRMLSLERKLKASGSEL